MEKKQTNEFLASLLSVMNFVALCIWNSLVNYLYDYPILLMKKKNLLFSFILGFCLPNVVMNLVT